VHAQYPEKNRSSLGVSMPRLIRTVLGARYDYFNFDVHSRIQQNINGVELGPNSGQEHDDKLAVKGSAIYTFNEEWETYFSIGQGLVWESAPALFRRAATG
jgi:hypothetical protein